MDIRSHATIFFVAQKISKPEIRFQYDSEFYINGVLIHAIIKRKKLFPTKCLLCAYMKV